MVAESSDPDRRAGLPRLVALLLLPPVAWGLHTGAIYLLVTIECIGEWRGSTSGVLLVTAVFAACSAWAGWSAWRSWRKLGGPARDPREARPFVYIMTIAGSVLFTAAILLAATTPLLVPPCVSNTVDPPLSVLPPAAQFRS